MSSFSEQTGDSSAFLNVMSLLKHVNSSFIFHISIRINCDGIGVDLLYFLPKCSETESAIKYLNDIMTFTPTFASMYGGDGCYSDGHVLRIFFYAIRMCSFTLFYRNELSKLLKLECHPFCTL
jgi:hypothetical protein